MKNQGLYLSVIILSMERERNNIYDGRVVFRNISNFEEAHYLSLYAMKNLKKDNELVVITAGCNLDLSQDDVTKMNEIVKKHYDDMEV